MTKTFNFGVFLLENGFSYTNAGHTQYYHIGKDGVEHHFKIIGLNFEHTQPAMPKFSKTTKTPLTKRTAIKIIKEL